MPRILILYASSHGHTRVVAQKLGDLLRARDARVHLADVASSDPPEVYDFDVAVLGSRIHFGTPDRRLRSYVTSHRIGLTSRPSYLFSVGMAASTPTGAKTSLAALDLWCKGLSWTPRKTAAFAGALLYRSYNPLMRVAMKLLSRRNGYPTDTSRDHDLTDWAAVTAFADEIAVAAKAIAGPGPITAPPAQPLRA